MFGPDGRVDANVKDGLGETKRDDGDEQDFKSPQSLSCKSLSSHLFVWLGRSFECEIFTQPTKRGPKTCCGR